MSQRDISSTIEEIYGFSIPWMVSAALKKALLPSSLAQWCNAALSI